MQHQAYGNTAVSTVAQIPLALGTGVGRLMNFKQRLRGWAAAPVREGIEPFVARASHFMDPMLAEKRERNPLLAWGARYFPRTTKMASSLKSSAASN